MNLKGKYYNGADSLQREAELIIDGESITLLDKSTNQFHTWFQSKIDYKNYGNNVIQINFINENGDHEVFESIGLESDEYEEAQKKLFFLHKDIPSKILFFNLKAIVPAALFVFGFCAASYFYFIPFIAEKIAENTPLHIEQELGEMIDKSISQDLNIDSSQTKSMMAFYNALGHKSKYKIDIKVVDEDVMNAFALPSGKIYVYTGLLKEMKRPEQLISVLYHEIGHVENKHSLKHIYRSLSRSLIVASIANDINGISNIIVENANMIMQLKHSKELETDADNYSLKSMYNENIDIKGYIEMFEMMEKEMSTKDIPELLSSHPMNSNRIKAAKSFKDKQKLPVLRKEVEDLFWKIY